MDTVASLVTMTARKGQHIREVSFCVHTRGPSGRGQTLCDLFTDATQEMCSLHESKLKHLPMRFSFLCGLY